MNDRTADIIVKKAKEGDEEAFDRLMKRHQKRLFRLIFKMVGNHSHSSDILQETFIKVYRYISNYDSSKGSFNAWINRIAINCCYDFFKENPDPKFSYDEVYQNEIKDESTVDSIAFNMDKEKIVEQIYNILTSLPPKQRTAFVMKDLEHYSTKETAQSMGCTETTVRRHLSEAREKIREKLKNRYPEFFKENN